MPTRIVLHEDQERLIERQLASGRYASPSCVIAAALRLLDERVRADGRLLAELDTVVRR